LKFFKASLEKLWSFLPSSSNFLRKSSFLKNWKFYSNYWKNLLFFRRCKISRIPQSRLRKLRVLWRKLKPRITLRNSCWPQCHESMHNL
jgi:hypothetical protein